MGSCDIVQFVYFLHIFGWSPIDYQIIALCMGRGNHGTCDCTKGDPHNGPTQPWNVYMERPLRMDAMFCWLGRGNSQEQWGHVTFVYFIHIFGSRIIISAQ